MFDSGDNVAGLDAFTFPGIEVAGQHIAFDPVQFRFPDQFFSPCLGEFGQRHG